MFPVMIQILPLRSKQTSSRAEVPLDLNCVAPSDFLNLHISPASLAWQPTSSRLSSSIPLLKCPGVARALSLRGGHARTVHVPVHRDDGTS